MAFPLNRMAGQDIVAALKARGIDPSRLAAALELGPSSSDRTAEEPPVFTVAQARRIESLAGVSLATLAMEGLYLRSANDPARLAELDEAAGIFSDLRPELTRRPPVRRGVSKPKRHSSTTPTRRRAS